jgi:hypothetical protein
MNVTTFGLDIAKNVMQVHWVDGQTGEVGRALKRSQLAPFFARQAHIEQKIIPCLIGPILVKSEELSMPEAPAE